MTPMDDAERIRLAATFDSAAELYDRARPRFAEAAVDWALPVGARRVLDLGAGTGKLTASLVERGLDVIAMDPSPNMLALLRDRFPDVDARGGSAEAIGLPDAAVDAVVAGSAFHWFARPAADAEIARVLRPGGRVGLLWNQRDPSSPTVAAFDAAQRHATEPQVQEGSDVTLDGQWFWATERAEFSHVQPVTRDQLVELVASRSYVMAMGEPDRTELLKRVRGFADEHARQARTATESLSGVGAFDLPYLTLVRRAARRG